VQNNVRELFTEVKDKAKDVVGLKDALLQKDKELKVSDAKVVELMQTKHLTEKTIESLRDELHLAKSKPQKEQPIEVSAVPVIQE
jgi:hypothetical protein